ncbi:hypothetical protein [Alteribacillus sp. YIM 98480]|uniref:hypothetical protein n=1 Tax=Alteribacillus sp. YIM 98480 TaxID=2606599 RepID=UPI00131DA796|nr:hypothetical protein [Alteribacillus sp. YIM 98480]
MEREKRPPRTNDAQEEEWREFPAPQEQVADAFVEGTVVGEIEEDREADIPPEEEGIMESEEK